jgi:hypothetical protein
MTLAELSASYESAAVPLRARLRELRQLLSEETDPEKIWHLQRRIAELTPMLTQMNELAELCERYYERGYYRGTKYTL